MAEPLWKRNNNPGNIRDFKAGGFRTYGSLEEGMQAWKSLLDRRYFGRGLNTPKSILYTYAPPTDNNNTSAYVDFVSKRMGITPDTVLDPTNQDQMANLASAMFKMETGHSFTPDEIKQAWGATITPVVIKPSQEIPEQEQAQPQQVTYIGNGYSPTSFFPGMAKQALGWVANMPYMDYLKPYVNLLNNFR